MPKGGIPELLREIFIGLLILLPLFAPRLVCAQQADIPPAANPEDQTVQTADPKPAVESRIVEGRPNFYGVRQSLHPFTWLSSGVKPLLRRISQLPVRKLSDDDSPPVSGVKFGVRGHGQGSGMGPEVKLFHRDLFNLGIKAELPVSVTYKVYELAAFRLEFPLSGADNDRVGFELTGRYASRPSENFFGIGNDSVDSARAEFRGVTREGGGGVVTRISDAWSLRVGALYRSVGITHPRKFRSASDVFQGESLPGLTVEPAASFLVSTVLLQHDTRDNPDLPGKGGLQRVEVRLNEGQTGGDFSYWQYRGQLQQFFPFSSDGRTVIGIRGSIETNQPKGGSSVPVFDLPFIGSYSTLRGFQNRRFVDRSAVTGTVEYRYRIWRHFDWGFFVDQGQVAPEVRDFAWDRLHTGYGMRFVMRAGKRRAFVVDMARSREEPFKLYLDFSPLF